MSASSPPPPSPPPPPPTSTTTIHTQCSLPGLNHDHPRPVFPPGPQPRPSTLRVHALPDLNHDHPHLVFPAGPQPTTHPRPVFPAEPQPRPSTPRTTKPQMEQRKNGLGFAASPVAGMMFTSRSSSHNGLLSQPRSIRPQLESSGQMHSSQRQIGFCNPALVVRRQWQLLDPALALCWWKLAWAVATVWPGGSSGCFSLPGLL